MPQHPRTEDTLLYLCAQLSARKIAYLHVVYQFMPSDNVSIGEFSHENLNPTLVAQVRATFLPTLIMCGGFTGYTAQAAVDAGWADLIAFPEARRRIYWTNVSLTETVQGPIEGRISLGHIIAKFPQCAGFEVRDRYLSVIDPPVCLAQQSPMTHQSRNIPCGRRQLQLDA
jgi:hypothetical protein